MDEKISLQNLAEHLALRTGDSKEQAEDFIKEFFALITDSLTDDGFARVKDMGVFKTISVEARKSVNVSTGDDHEIPAHRKVTFTPSKEMAAKINEPFEMFETVEIADDIQLDDSEDPVENTPYDETEPFQMEKPTAEQPSEVDNEQEDFEEDDEPLYTYPSDEDAEEMPAESPVEETEEMSLEATAEAHAQSPAEVQERQEEQIVEKAEEPISPKKRGRYWFGFLSGAACMALIAVAAYFLLPHLRPATVADSGDTPRDSIATTEKTIASATIAEPEAEQREESATSAQTQTQAAATAEDVPTQPSDAKASAAPVYDTITKTRYLTTMAKDHYGNFNLWPYIYEENKSFLGHPDRIKPGTQVVVPDLKKYSVDPNNPADIKKAKRMGIEIYSRYK